ncbi:uroporphyrinogen-III synthase-like [Adelges cooleyi]|uniref:uroporphyrinogen-III synthase-like n=1 Tax=Adelges cooleyi TaxID=133065 RepID=UPI00217F2681|nr:uroporphyrinogen-III synthase-like [Adelges cooleyi]XP_050437495.1 uroporphyrinogen-III synthase-like [Adelges cooleyi]XP_050437496.1 uroporphyrinogen-III synthase-like [Adelges cooleyi]
MTGKMSFIILKAQNEENESTDPYIEVLHEKGYDAHFVPTLQFEYYNLDELRKKLQNPQDYSGLVLTSPRCVRGVLKCLDNSKLNNNWHNKPIFVVGEATARLVTKELNQKPIGANTGNATALVPIILKYELSKPLLAPCGNLNLNILADNLNTVKLENVEIYRTVPHSDLEKNLKLAFDTIKYRIGLVFFSPSGFQACIKLIPKEFVNKLHIFSIGPTTASAIEEAGYALTGICDKPKPESMMDIIDKFIE